MIRALFLFLLLPLTAQAFWPLAWELGGEKRYLGPLISHDREKGERHLTVRPFFFSYDSEEGGIYHFLYPLGKRTREKTYLIPLYLSNRTEEATNTSFLFFFHGTSKEQSYFGFFPLYGRMYNRFGKDELSFFLWPLYSYTASDGATKRSVLWPFFSLYGGAEKGGKFWPFYGRREREGVRSATFFLWPVFFLEDKNLDTHEPVNSFYAFPFYIRSTSDTKAAYDVLFPLFSYRRDEDKRKWGFFFSLYSMTEGEETRGYSLFPIVSSERRDKDRTFTLFWPLYKESEWFVGEQRFSETRVAVMSRKSEDDRGTFFNLWPFFEKRTKGDESALFVPSLIPVREKGFDRIVRPLLTLYEEKRDGPRETVNVLYGLYTMESEGENWRRRLAFLLEVKKEEGETGFEILSGLFGMDRKRIKVFFLSFPRTPE